MNKTGMKCTRDCLTVFWLSIFAIFLISAIEGSPPKPELISIDDVTYSPIQDTIIKDTIRKDTVDFTQLNKKEIAESKKKIEFQEYQQRQKRFDENISELDRQSKVMDSILNALDTTKVVL